jgi:hypothetical protein
MLTQKKRKPMAKIWLEYEGKPLLGKGGTESLKPSRKRTPSPKPQKKLECRIDTPGTT